MGVAQLVWLWNTVKSALWGQKVVSDDPWNLGDLPFDSPEWEWFAEQRTTDDTKS
jgi:hypothetical protein